MKLVYTARDVSDAHLIKQLLEDNEIPAIIEGERLYALRGEMPAVYPSVWASNETDVERAREIIESFQKSAPLRGEHRDTWVCPKCGEEIENQFSACWHCTEAGEGAAKIVDPSTRKTRTALVAALFLALGCGFLSFFMKHLQQSTPHSDDTTRMLAHVVQLANLAFVLFCMLTVFFMVQLANTGSASAQRRND